MKLWSYTLFHSDVVGDIAKDRSFDELVTDQAWVDRADAVRECIRAINMEVEDVLEGNGRLYLHSEVAFTDAHDGDTLRWMFFEEQTGVTAVLFEIKVEGL